MTASNDGKAELSKEQLQKILLHLLDTHELDVPQSVDETNVATLNKVGLRGAIAECLGFEYYDSEPYDHWAARTRSHHREGQEAFSVDELEQVRDVLVDMADINRIEDHD
jgi:seryl-tRNA synthetase